MLLNYVVAGIFVVSLHAEDAPLNPGGLILEAQSSTSVHLNWIDNSTDETGFKIFRDGILIATTGVDVTSYIDDELLANTTYTYTVKSTNDVANPFNAIKALIELSNNGLEDVTYICVGDSTRAGPLSPFDNPASPYDGGHVFEPS